MPIPHLGPATNGGCPQQVAGLTLCKEIDERVHTFLNRPLPGVWPYLGLDAIYLKQRRRLRRLGRRDNCRGRQTLMPDARSSGCTSVPPRPTRSGPSQDPGTARAARRQAGHLRCSSPQRSGDSGTAAAEQSAMASIAGGSRIDGTNAFTSAAAFMVPSIKDSEISIC